MSYNMSSSMKKTKTPRVEVSREELMTEAALLEVERRMGGVANKAVDENGEIDLRRLTGKEALTYMNALGIRMGGRN